MHRQVVTGKKAWLVIALLLVLIVATVGVGLFMQGRMQERQLKLVMIDVGDGDALLLVCEGQAMLVDAGKDPQASAVLAALQEHGITRLDAVVLTHGDKDHAQGMPQVLQTVPTAAFFSPEDPYASPAMLDARAAAQAAGARMMSARAGRMFSLGGAQVSFLWPLGAAADADEDSVVLMVEYLGKRLLLAGDITKSGESALLQSTVSLACDVLKVPHHGQKGACSKPFVQATQPQIALITTAADEPPANKVIQCLQDVGAQIYTTPQDGTVTVTITAQGLAVQTAAQATQAPAAQ